MKTYTIYSKTLHATVDFTLTDAEITRFKADYDTLTERQKERLHVDTFDNYVELVLTYNN